MIKIDGEAIEVNCSNCGCPIGEIWKLDKKTELKKIRFNCGQCKDYSFYIDIDRKFYVGSTEYCRISLMDETDGIINIETVKVKEYE